MKIDLDDLVSTAEVAALLHTDLSGVARRVRQGRLPKPIKLGHATRWLRRDVLKAAEEDRALAATLPPKVRRQRFRHLATTAPAVKPLPDRNERPFPPAGRLQPRAGMEVANDRRG